MDLEVTPVGQQIVYMLFISTIVHFHAKTLYPLDIITLTTKS